MKILNLFAGIGGNRQLWGDDHEITAIEHNEQIADIYQKRFPNDAVFIGDAYGYLESMYKGFDFIWASPPCPTHSKLAFCQKIRHIPDMRLYGIIYFLKHFFWGKWVVENVEGFYTPLIKPTIKLGRHYFWANFPISQKKFQCSNIRYANIKTLKEENHAEDVLLFKGMEERRILRNMVKPEIGKYILDSINTKTLEAFM